MRARAARLTPRSNTDEAMAAIDNSSSLHLAKMVTLVYGGRTVP